MSAHEVAGDQRLVLEQQGELTRRLRAVKLDRPEAGYRLIAFFQPQIAGDWKAFSLGRRPGDTRLRPRRNVPRVTHVIRIRDDDQGRPAELRQMSCVMNRKR
jgi:hypothetical protein